MEQEVLDFIHRRFPQDSNWTSGNCYYFAKILLERFYSGDIYYDVIDGHFVYGNNGEYFDYNGKVSQEGRHLIKWKNFTFYDYSQYLRILRDCIE